MELSVVVPVFDEEDNVEPLFRGIEGACAPLGIAYEVVFVDDGSRDATWERLRSLEPVAGELVLVGLRRNCGQTPAMAAGFDLARGRVVVSMDGDLQNDPADIPKMLERHREGYDLVCGWRVNRKDKLLSRKIPSRCANWLIRCVTGVKVHDYGCSLKVYSKSLVRRMRLYSDMHRFLPFISQQVGARISETPVNHRARVHGVSKYGLSRIWKVLADLLTLKVLVHYHMRMRFWFAIMSVPLFVLFLGLLIAHLVSVHETYVLLACAIVVGSLGLFIGTLGLLSEMILQDNREEFDRLLVIDAQSGEAIS